MALNRYSKLPEATIKNTQVLTDLGIIDTALQRKQKQYDAKAATIGGSVDAAQQLPMFGEAANGFKTKMVEDLKSKVGEISSMDLADPNVTKDVDQYIQQVGNDPELAKHTKAATAHNEFLETQQKLSESGKLPTSANILREKAWNEYSQSGMLPPEATQPLYENQNLIKGRSELVDMIKSSSHEGTALMDGMAYGVKSGGVSYGKIGKAVKDQLNAYANSPYGRQEYDDFRVGQLSGNIPKDAKFNDYLLKSVMSTAQNHAYSNTSNDYSSIINKKEERAYQEKKKKEEEYNGEGFSPATAGRPDVEIDSDDRINQPWYSDAYDAVTGGDSRGADVKAQEAKIDANMKQAGFQGTRKEYVDQVLNTDANIRVKYFSPKKSEEISKQFYDGNTKGGTFVNSRIWDAEEQTWISAPDYFKKKKLSDAEAKAGFTITGELSPDNPYTHKGFQGIIGGESVIIDNSASRSKNPSDDTASMFTHEANKVRYSPDESGSHTWEQKDPKDGQTWIITSRLDAEGNLAPLEYKLKK